MAEKKPPKTPLQEEKKKAIQEKVDAGKAEVKPKRAYTRKAKVPPVDPAQLQKEGEFFIELIQSMRKGVGIEKSIPETTRNVFIHSWGAMSAKYGSIMATWMPEIMFGGSVLLIAFDSFKEVNKIRGKKPKPEVKEPAKETPLGEREYKPVEEVPSNNPLSTEQHTEILFKNFD